MLFNSTDFITFFATVLVIYYLIKDRRKQNFLLLAASYIFYGIWGPKYLILLVGGTTVDYWAGLMMARKDASGEKKKWLLLSLISNLGALAYFKYYNFGIESFASILDWIGAGWHPVTLNLILPIGISFYTFQRIAYIVDVYRGQARPTRDFWDFALFVSFFPQLIAGPIERASNLLKQIQEPRRRDLNNLKAGMALMLIGYFKKCVMGDSAAWIVDKTFGDPSAVTGITHILGTLGFGVQLYCDFAGYSLIALGAARMLGIHLTINFKHPYLSQNPRELWEKWHITLSRWMRDYLYIPLGGNRKGKRRTQANILMTMGLAGLWHGAAWQQVIWGLYHGAVMVLSRGTAWNKMVSDRRSPSLWVKIGLTFIYFSIGHFIFRVESMNGLYIALDRVVHAFYWGPETTQAFLTIIGLYALLMSYHLWQWISGDYYILLKQRFEVRLFFYAFMLGALFVSGLNRNIFLYFQF